MHSTAYPLPTSFPRIFESNHPKADTVSLFTSLSTTPRTYALFSTYARFVETHLDFGGAVGLDRDEMKELGNDLWAICDGYGDTDADVAEDELGEDEE